MVFQCSTTPSSTAHLRWNHKKAAERELSLSPATQPRRSTTTFFVLLSGRGCRKELGTHLHPLFLREKPRGAPRWHRAPPNTPLPGVLGQLSASLGHPVCWKTSDSCRRVARAANRSPCVGLIRALRCSCSSSVPAPPGAFLSRAFPPPPSSSAELFSVILVSRKGRELSCSQGTRVCPLLRGWAAGKEEVAEKVF